MLTDNKRIELLAPAGSLDTLKAVAAAGADAVYCGGKQYLPFLSMNYRQKRGRAATSYMTVRRSLFFNESRFGKSLLRRQRFPGGLDAVSRGLRLHRTFQNAVAGFQHRGIQVDHLRPYETGVVLFSVAERKHFFRASIAKLDLIQRVREETGRQVFREGIRPILRAEPFKESLRFFGVFRRRVHRSLDRKSVV